MEEVARATRSRRSPLYRASRRLTFPYARTPTIAESFADNYRRVPAFSIYYYAAFTRRPNALSIRFASISKTNSPFHPTSPSSAIPSTFLSNFRKNSISFLSANSFDFPQASKRSREKRAAEFPNAVTSATSFACLRKLSRCSASPLLASLTRCSRVINLRRGLNQTSNAATQPTSLVTLLRERRDAA